MSEIETITSTTDSIKKKRTRTDEQRLAYNAYQRKYRQLHPDAIRRHRRQYILRAARRIEAEGGADHE